MSSAEPEAAWSDLVPLCREIEAGALTGAARKAEAEKADGERPQGGTAGEGSSHG